jgi:protease I
MKVKLLLILFSILLLFNCADKTKKIEKGGIKEMNEEKSNVKVLLVIAEDQFRDEEALEPIKIFKDEGYNVTVASTSSKTAKGMFGAELTPDIVISEVNPDEYDILSVTGGMGSPTYLWNNLDLHNIVKSFYEKGKIIGAICLSPVVLVKTGILNGKQVTCYVTDDVKKEFESGNVGLSSENVVVTDNQIITGNGPQAASDYARKIIEIFKSKQ